MNNVILIGFMGCGKTSVGKRFSSVGKMTFLDTDEYIVTREGKSVTEIFKTSGEPYFRNRETECIQELIQKQLSDSVISVGGGLPMREENRKLLRELGEVIYLRATSATIYERVQYDSSRPLLQTENPRERITCLTNDRSAVYEAAATAIVDVDGKSLDEIIKEIQKVRRNVK